MRLTVVGCSGSFPGPESAASCYLVEEGFGEGAFRLVLDLGSGALGPLQRHIALDAVDAVVLSHLHPDHCFDLCGYYVFRKYRPGGRLARIPVYGPGGVGARLARAYDLPEPDGMSTEFDFRSYPDEPFQLGPFTVRVAPVVHPVAAYAIRIEHGGRSLVYSGDTAACDSLTELAKGCDLLLAEASFVEGANNPANLHLTGRDAGEAAEAAGAARLVLTHVPPWHSRQQALSEASQRYRGPISLAAPGISYEI